MTYTVLRTHREMYVADVKATSEKEALRIAKEIEPDSFDSYDQSEYTFKVIGVED